MQSFLHHRWFGCPLWFLRISVIIALISLQNVGQWVLMNLSLSGHYHGLFVEHSHHFVRIPRSHYQPQTGVRHCSAVSHSSQCSISSCQCFNSSFVVIFGLLIIFNNFLNKDFGISCLWNSFCFWNLCLLPGVFVQEAFQIDSLHCRILLLSVFLYILGQEHSIQLLHHCYRKFILLVFICLRYFSKFARQKATSSVFHCQSFRGSRLVSSVVPGEAWLILFQLKTVDLEHHYCSIRVVPGFQETLLVIMHTKASTSFWLTGF